jgi:hypothetical protein
MKGFFSKLFGGGSKPQALPPPPGDAAIQEDPNNPQNAQKKKGFFGKIAGIFKDDKSSAPAQKPADPAQTGQPAPH